MENNAKKKTFWNTLPVVHDYKYFPNDFQIIDPGYSSDSLFPGYGPDSISPEFMESIYPLTKENMPQVLDFLNNNYISGYIYSADYLSRKMEINGAIGLLYISNNKIYGFIYCCPYKWRGKTFGYVDLLCVEKSIRGKAVASKLIICITYRSPNKIFLHKKDNDQLPFQHFYFTSHYSCRIDDLLRKYRIMGESIYKQLEDPRKLAEKTGQDTCIFRSSESIKTYSNGKSYFSIAIFKFDQGTNTPLIAQLFYVDDDFTDYDELIKVLYQNRIEILTVLPKGIFKNKIVSDNYSKEMDLYLYAGNIVVHPIEMNICMP